MCWTFFNLLTHHIYDLRLQHIIDFEYMYLKRWFVIISLWISAVMQIVLLSGFVTPCCI